MKRTTTFAILTFLFASQIYSQVSSTPSNWTGTRFGVTFGGDIEMPLKLNHSYLLSTAEDSDLSVDHLPFDEGELTRMDCDNETARISISMAPNGSTTTELQFSLLSIEGRIDMVRYSLPEENQFLEVSAENKELALEGVYLKRDQVNRTFTFYYGAGTNIGYSYGGKVKVSGFLNDAELTDDPNVAQEVEYLLEQRDGINQRLFAQGGMGIRLLKRIELGLNFRKGFGYRASFGGPFKLTRLKRSIGMSLKYSFL